MEEAERLVRVEGEGVRLPDAVAASGGEGVRVPVALGQEVGAV